MNAAVLGNGFLGKAFKREGFTVLGKSDFHIPLNDTLIDYNVLAPYDVIINCIGKSNTRWCEQNFEAALFSNAYIPKLLSSYCKTHGKRFVHISSGCLYDGADKDNIEDNFIAAHCNYTVTKWAGEQFCCPDDLILRPRLFFGDFQDKNNLLCKLYRFGKFLQETNSYSSVHDIVCACQALLREEQTGIFNVACSGSLTLQDFAKLLDIDAVNTIEVEELHKQENLYLVNNTMNLDKLKQYYAPVDVTQEILRCKELLNN